MKKPRVYIQVGDDRNKLIKIFPHSAGSVDFCRLLPARRFHFPHLLLANPASPASPASPSAFALLMYPRHLRPRHPYPEVDYFKYVFAAFKLALLSSYA